MVILDGLPEKNTEKHFWKGSCINVALYDWKHIWILRFKFPMYIIVHFWCMLVNICTMKVLLFHKNRFIVLCGGFENFYDTIHYIDKYISKFYNFDFSGWTNIKGVYITLSLCCRGLISILFVIFKTQIQCLILFLYSLDINR